ncbi:MAG: hypothetical protein KAT46_01040 [Deltaproteobacteria bacterium]|nr:hypothetical protein [Deltaproteobacteria bacterium]
MDKQIIDIGVDTGTDRAANLGAFFFSLFSKTIKNLILGALVFGIIFLLNGGLVVVTTIKGLDYHPVLESAFGLLAVFIYTVIGGVLGFFTAVTSIVSRGIEEVEKVVMELADSLALNVAKRIPFAEKGITFEEFEEIVNKTLRGRPAQGGNLFSPLRIISAFIALRIIGVIRLIFLGDFMETIEKSGGLVTPASIERFARERVGNLVTGTFKANLFLLRSLLWVVILLFTILPLGYTFFDYIQAFFVPGFTL